MRLGLIVLLVVLLASGAAGCQDLDTASSTTAQMATPPTSGDSTTAPTPAEASTTTAVQEPTTAAPVTTATTAFSTTTTVSPATTTTTAPAPTPPVELSPEAADYARDLGGVSHKGQKLYFVIGVSVESEAEALELLEDAKAVGDMQTYFIVQNSTNFEGMNPGWWIIFEAYREYPSEDNIDFCRRAFPGAYVKSATVLTDDPIPVYEDMMGI